MFQGIVEILEELNPSSLSPSYFLWFLEVLKVFVICKDFDGVLHTQEEGASTFEAKDDASEFFIMNIIILFSREEAPRVKHDRIHAIVVFLSNDHPQCITRCISMHDKGFQPVGGFQYWLTCTDML